MPLDYESDAVRVAIFNLYSTAAKCLVAFSAVILICLLIQKSSDTMIESIKLDRALKLAEIDKKTCKQIFNNENRQ